MASVKLPSEVLLVPKGMESTSPGSESPGRLRSQFLPGSSESGPHQESADSWRGGWVPLASREKVRGDISWAGERAQSAFSVSSALHSMRRGGVSRHRRSRSSATPAPLQRPSMLILLAGSECRQALEMEPERVGGLPPVLRYSPGSTTVALRSGPSRVSVTSHLPCSPQ